MIKPNSWDSKRRHATAFLTWTEPQLKSWNKIHSLLGRKQNCAAQTDYFSRQMDDRAGVETCSIKSRSLYKEATSAGEKEFLWKITLFWLSLPVFWAAAHLCPWAPCPTKSTNKQAATGKASREQNLKQTTSEGSKEKDLLQRHSYKQPTVLQPLRKLAEEPSLFFLYFLYTYFLKYNILGKM